MRIGGQSIHQESGFTLIELLVVVSIVSLLASIAVPAFNDYKDKAKTAEARATIRGIVTALNSLNMQNGVWPAGSWGNLSGPSLATAIQDEYVITGLDPWGTPYYYDGCPGPVSACGGGGAEDGPYQSSVCSAGPDKNHTSFNRPERNDDICYYFET